MNNEAKNIMIDINNVSAQMIALKNKIKSTELSEDEAREIHDELSECILLLGQACFSVAKN